LPSLIATARRENKLTENWTVSDAVGYVCTGNRTDVGCVRRRARQIRAAFLGARRLAGLSKRLVLIYPLVGVDISGTFGRELLRMLAKNLSNFLHGLLDVGW
jgi:hypothetical protein